MILARGAGALRRRLSGHHERFRGRCRRVPGGSPAADTTDSTASAAASGRFRSAETRHDARDVLPGPAIGRN
jgi:hypothetical protein